MNYDNGNFYGDSREKIRAHKGIKLSPNTLSVEVYAESRGYSVTLPKAEECAFRFLSIIYIAGSYTVSVVGSFGDVKPFDTIQFTDDSGFALLFSTGKTWKVAAGNIV